MQELIQYTAIKHHEERLLKVKVLQKVQFYNPGI